ncbi:MAG: DNA methylase [Eubacterium sp.]|nr:DNA methylase [Eubacterium sp.]
MKYPLPDSERTYIAIDLKSFYASVECRELGRDPLTTHLVVADASRTEKTICLAVSPSLKAYGIPGRARLFEVVQAVKKVNGERISRAPGHHFTGSSDSAPELEADSSLELKYIVAPPRMKLYMDYSAGIYDIYLKYIAPEDIHVYSIDEVMMDVTGYLKTYKMTARELAMQMIRDVLSETGITATAGIGPNLYLAKIAMDIGAKHVEPDKDGVRIAWLDEMSYRRQLWDHQPLTDFWRVGRGYARKLNENGIFTMGDVARCSLEREDLLYDLFGVNAELLIDHAWGYEPCTMDLVKSYQPENYSVISGQVLQSPYDFRKARIVVHEMADAAALDLVEKRMVTDQLVLTVGYDRESLNDPAIRKKYKNRTKEDRYGRLVPKHAHGTENLPGYTSSGNRISQAALNLYDRIIDPDLLIRRMSLSLNHLIPEDSSKAREPVYEQIDLFTDYEALQQERKKNEAAMEKERRLQEAMLSIKGKYGKNAILKGTNFEEGATGRERNNTVGGHKA